MNPQYISAGFIHTVPGKLMEYFVYPFTNISIIISLVMMFANVYMFRKLRKIKKRDYIEVLNLFTIGIYIVFSIISAVLVARLGPHGTLTLDDCDKGYMFIPKTLFIVVAIVNVIFFIVNILTKLKKDKEYRKTNERGYFAEEKTSEDIEEHGGNFIDNIKNKFDVDEIKDKVNNITEDIKNIINSKIKKNE